MILRSLLAQRTSAKFGAVHPIATLPPTYGENSQPVVKVKVGQITLQHFQLNEFLKDLNIVGYMQLQWSDNRLSWDSNQWKLDKLQIHSANHIWIPVLSSQSYDTSLQVIEFAVDGLPVFTDPKYFRDYGWSVSGTIPTVTADPSVVSQLNFCINLQRSSSAVKIELAIPTWICSIIFLFTPFMGKIRIQFFVKLFVLLLQFMALQLFSNRIAPHLGSASATPVILAIHEFAMIMNTISIVASVIVWMLSRIKRNLPPWGWLIRASQIINRFICVFNSVDDNDGAFEMEKGGLPGESNPNSRYQSDWEAAFLAIHGVVVMFLSIIFIIGYIIIR
uniref:Neurotransmitter-gated ion-channel ligand-binding domain-containing protein n=1 Tax=Panagrolaimus sp. ES5 TaxID=591445 RepID=A0AC34FEJ4_9BILA